MPVLFVHLSGIVFLSLSLSLSLSIDLSLSERFAERKMLVATTDPASPASHLIYACAFATPEIRDAWVAEASDAWAHRPPANQLAPS